MGSTGNGKKRFSMVWLTVAVLGITTVAGAGFLATGVQCKQVFAWPSPFQTAGTRAAKNEQQKFFSLLKIEDAQEALPQFVIQGKLFTVVIHKQRLKWPAEAQHRFDPDDDETARSFEVRDAAGVAVYKQKIEEAAGESGLAEIRKQGRFAFTEAVYASRMQGARNQAMVIGWSSLPSAPHSCSTYVVLGLFEGKLVPFSEPFCENIVSSAPDSPDHTWKLKRDSGTDFEIFEIRRGYGFFHITIPIRVDFLTAKLLPARWCMRMGAPAPLADHCEFPVEAERNAAREDTFVRLFASADDSGTPRHVVVKPDSRIEFLAALAPNAMDRSGKWKNDHEGGIPWLKLRIDGNEGWVHAEEDLNALGLFQAG